jgi:hypothetical protein
MIVVVVVVVVVVVTKTALVPKKWLSTNGSSIMTAVILAVKYGGDT